MAIVPPTPANIDAAASALRAGDLIGLPTETVYGLAGNALDDRAVASIFATKGRPQFNPLICHLPDVVALEPLVALDDRARAVAARFWPGPLTLVLPRRPDCPVSLLASAGLDTLAVRVPAHPVAQALLRRAGVPVAAPSANRSGRISPTRPDHVIEDLGPGILVLDGGTCAVGVESTILDLSEPQARLLRPGGIAVEQIEALTGPLAGVGAGIKAPGMLASHYAPAKPLRLEAGAPRGREALLAFGGPVPSGYAHVLNLSPGGDLAEAAANLFAYLRRLDAGTWDGIAAMAIPAHGLGLAINDRLRRAAAPRDVAA
jgi:L-threonylcarbamoyladenylate synthase